MAQKFWEQPGFKQYLENRRQTREQNKLRKNTIKQANSLTIGSPASKLLSDVLGGLNLRTPYTSVKQVVKQREWEITRKPQAPASTRQMPDRVGERPASNPLTYIQQLPQTVRSVTPRTYGTVVPGGAPRVVPPTAPARPAPKYSVTPTTQAGQEVYALHDVNKNLTYLTSSPTRTKVYNYNGVPIFVNQDDNGNWQLDEDVAAMGITFDQLVPATYSPDLVEDLNYTKTVDELLKPMTIDGMMKPNAPLYYDPIQHQITSRPTQRQLFIGRDGEFTDARTSVWRDGLVHPNNPAILDDKTSKYLATWLTSRNDEYTSDQTITAMGNPITGNDIRSGRGQVTLDQIKAQGEIDITYQDPELESINVSQEGKTPEYVATTAQTSARLLPFNLYNIVRDSRVIQVLAGGVAGLFDQQKQKTNTQFLLDVASTIWIGLTESSNVVKQAPMSSEKYMNRQSGFGGTSTAATIGNILSFVVGVPLAGLAYVASPLVSIFNKDAAQDMRSYSKDLTHKIYDKMAVMTDQLANSAYFMMEQPTFGWSPTQQLKPEDKLRRSQFEMAVGITPTSTRLAPETQPEEEYGQKNSLAKRVDTMNANVDAGISMKLASDSKYKAGLVDEAVDFRTEGIYKYFTQGLDWAAIDNYISQDFDTNYKPNQTGTDALLASDIPVTREELEFLWRFMAYGQVKNSWMLNSMGLESGFPGPLTNLAAGVNYDFMRHIAKIELQTGHNLTLDEMYNESQMWLKDWFDNPTDVKTRREFLQERSRSIHDRAMSIKDAAVAYMKLGDEARAATLMKEAQTLLVGVIDIDRKAHTLDAYSAYTWEAYPEKKQQFYDNLAAAELNLGRPLTRQEIIDISYLSVDMVHEMGGEVLFDIMNVLEFLKVGEVAIHAGQAAVLKGLRKTEFGVSVIDDFIKLSDDISQSALARHIKGRALVSQSHKIAQVASNLTTDILRSNPLDKKEFLETAAKVVDAINTVKSATSREEAIRALNTVMQGNLPKSITARDIWDAAEQMTGSIEPNKWVDTMDKVWDEQLEFMQDRATAHMSKRYANAPVGVAEMDLATVKANNIKAEAYKNMRSWSGKNRLSVEVGDKFRKAFSKQNEAWTSSVFMSDTWYAKVGNKLNQPFIKDTIKFLFDANQKLMNAWVWATLARRPAWMLYNFIDNTFRFFVSGSGDLRDIMFLMREDVTKQIAEEIGIRAEVSTDLAAASFRVLSQPLEGGAKELRHVPGIDELRQNPLGFLQHYRVNYAALTEGRGKLMHVYSVWRAFPHTVKSLAQTIEYGTRIRMYYKLYTKNIVKINKTLLANLIDGVLPAPGVTPIPGLKQRLLATGMNEIDADRWVKYVQDMWWKSGNNGAKFEQSLELLSQTGRYKNESMFMPEAMRKADWYDEELHRPLVISILDELQKYVTEQSKNGINRLSRTQTDQFFDRVIATVDAEISARMKPIWHQQYEMLHGFDEAEGYKNYKGGPYYPKMEAESGEAITESGHKAIQDVPSSAKTLSNKQRKTATKAIKDNKITLSGQSDADLAKGVEILRERAAKHAASQEPLTDAQVEAMENALKNNTPADIPTNADEATALNKAIEDNIPMPGRLDAGRRQAAAVHEFEALATPKTFDDTAAYQLLSKSDRDLVAAHAQHLTKSMQNFSARIHSYWTLSNPGPIQFDEAGRRITRNRATGTAWDLWDAFVTRLYDNQVLQFGELVDGIHSGNFSLLTTYTPKDMLDRAGISLDFDSQGRLVRLRMHNPTTNRWDEVTNPAALNRFKKITGVVDNKIYNESIQLMEVNYKPPTQERAMKIISKILPTPFQTYDEMTQSTPRLALAIQEKRLRDANLIIAGEFRYPMFYEKGAQLIPSDDRLMRRIWSELGPDSKALYKTLADVPPDVTHQILDRWAQTSHGYEVGKMIKDLEKDMIEVLQKQFGWKEAGAREFFKLYDKVIGNLAKFTSDTSGKLVTKEEMWANVFYGFYKMDPGTEANLLRSVDGRIAFQSNLRDFVDRVMTDGSTGKELLANMRVHRFSDAELKWNGMLKWLTDNKDEVISREGIKKFIVERERLVLANVGREGIWDIGIRNMNGDELVTLKAAMSIEADTNLYTLRVTKMDGALDDFSTKRLQRWARDNDADKLVLADGTEFDLRKLIDSKKPLRPSSGGEVYKGSIDFVENALKQQTALIKSYSAADITTASHEMFHAVFPHLPEEAKTVLNEWADDSILKLKDAKDPAYRQFAHLSPEIARQEAIAKAWEKYLVTEVAPNAEVGNIFKSIRNYLINVYKTMQDYFAGIYLTPEVRKVFDTMVDDGWKRQQAAKIPKPRGPRPVLPKAPAPTTPAAVQEQVVKSVQKAKETVTSTIKPKKSTASTIIESPAAAVADNPAIVMNGGEWMVGGKFWDTHRLKRFTKKQTAQDVIDFEINEMKGDLKLNPDIDMTTVKSHATAWVSFDKKIAKKYNRSVDKSGLRMPEIEFPFFRVLAVDNNGMALIEFSRTVPKGFVATEPIETIFDIFKRFEEQTIPIKVEKAPKKIKPVKGLVPESAPIPEAELPQLPPAAVPEVPKEKPIITGNDISYRGVNGIVQRSQERGFRILYYPEGMAGGKETPWFSGIKARQKAADAWAKEVDARYFPGEKPPVEPTPAQAVSETIAQARMAPVEITPLPPKAAGRVPDGAEFQYVLNPNTKKNYIIQGLKHLPEYGASMEARDVLTLLGKRDAISLKRLNRFKWRSANQVLIDFPVDATEHRLLLVTYTPHANVLDAAGNPSYSITGYEVTQAYADELMGKGQMLDDLTMFQRLSDDLDTDQFTKPNTVALIGNGFDYINDEIGDMAARDYARAMANALRSSGLDENDIFDMGGGRFVVQMDDPKQLDAILKSVDEAPTVRVSDTAGDMWDVDLSLSHSDVGLKNQIPDQFDSATLRFEEARATAYKKWVLENGSDDTFATDLDALDDAISNDAELMTHPNIRPADPMFQMVPHNTWYYHKAQVEVEKMNFKTTSTARLRSVLPNFISRDEMKWSGLDDFLVENRNITKEEVMNFLRGEQVELRETVLGAPVELVVEEVKDFDNNKYTSFVDTSFGIIEKRGDWPEFVVVNTATGNNVKSFLTEKQARDYIAESMKEPTRFDIPWTLPGGTNQREVILWTPGIEPFVPDKTHFTDVGGGRAISWFRGNDRLDTEGKRVFFVEEIQSKRHQVGRAEGYADETLKKNLLNNQEQLAKQYNDKFFEIANRDPVLAQNIKNWQENPGHAINQYDWGYGPEDTMRGYLMAEINRYDFHAHNGVNTIERSPELLAINNEIEKVRVELDRVISGVPDAPFSKNWEELTMKRIIRWASENDYDRVAWTTGKMQVDRYALTKFYDSIQYEKLGDGTIELYFWEKSGRSYDKQVVESAKLNEYVGEELSKKILDDPESTGVLSGIDLEVTDKNMSKIYDVKIPDITRKMIKKWGSDIREVNIGSAPYRVVKDSAGEHPYWIMLPNREAYIDPQTGFPKTFKTEFAANSFADLLQRRTGEGFGIDVIVQGFDVTPEMKRAAMAGEQSLWQKQGTPGYFSKAKKVDNQPEVDEAWRTFAQSPVFEHGSGKVSLVQLWNTLFGSEEKMLEAGPQGFANITSKLAAEYAEREMVEQAELMKNLSAMAMTFQDYIKGTAINLDALVPPPLPMWNMNPLIRQWVSNMFGVGSELEGAKRLVRTWKDEFGNNIEQSPLADLKISEEASKVLGEVGRAGGLDKAQLNDVANYGGRIAGHTINPSDGAVTATNFNMIDYTDFNKVDQFIKDIVPFWMYPAKSIPFWIKSIVQHPELVMAYNKYMRWSEMAAINYNATNSRGEQLPSLKGYVPLLPGLWFNPTAPLMFRYVFPNVDKMPEVDEDLTPLQKMSKFFLDDAPILGINVSPVLSAVLQTLYEPYYPKTNLGYELAKTVIPLEYIPPFVERWFISQARKIALGNVNVPERFQQEVSWKDYLIERQILTDALLRMKEASTQIEKEAIAKEAYAVITRDESLSGPREEDPIWVAARSKMEANEYYRRLAGMFTGIYAKEFTAGQAELNALRDEVNTLRDSVNNEVLAMLFKPYMSQADIYDAYSTRKYKTPEGWIWNSYQMSRYVTDEEGTPLTGQLRRDEMARQAVIENQTQLYYQALKAAADERDLRLLDIPVGATELRGKIMDEYYTEYMKINDPQGLYPLARRDYVMGYKPIEKIEEYITNEWWRQIRSTYPRRTPSETWSQYELRVDAWKDSLGDQAAKMAPIFQTNFNWRVFEGEIDTAERMKEVPAIMKKLLTDTNREGFDAWTKKGDTVIEAIWNAYEELYLKPYYDAVKDKTGNERRLAELLFLKEHTFEPTTGEIQNWINTEYGIDRFGDKLIRDTIKGLTFADPDEQEALKEKPKDPARDKVYDILAWAGPQQSNNYQALMSAYISLGGYESDFDVWWGTGGDVNNYSDIEKYYDFVRKIQLAGVKVSAQAPDEQMLIDMLQAEADHTEFKSRIMSELGGDFYTLLSMYMFMDSGERKEWRKINADLYKKIDTYYTRRDEWAADHPLWASYYYPSFDASTGSSYSSVSSGTSVSGGGGGTSGGGKYSSKFQREEEAWWIPMGKRASLDVMALFAPGKLGSGGVTDRPWWPQSLLDLLDPLAVEQVSAAANGTAPLPKATVTYLKKVAQKRPEFANAIRRNLHLTRQRWGVSGRADVMSMR